MSQRDQLRLAVAHELNKLADGPYPLLRTEDFIFGVLNEIACAIPYYHGEMGRRAGLQDRWRARLVAMLAKRGAKK